MKPISFVTILCFIVSVVSSNPYTRVVQRMTPKIMRKFKKPWEQAYLIVQKELELMKEAKSETNTWSKLLDKHEEKLGIYHMRFADTDT